MTYFCIKIEVNISIRNKGRQQTGRHTGRQICVKPFTNPLSQVVIKESAVVGTLCIDMLHFMIEMSNDTFANI